MSIRPEGAELRTDRLTRQR